MMQKIWFCRDLNYGGDLTFNGPTTAFKISGVNEVTLYVTSVHTPENCSQNPHLFNVAAETLSPRRGCSFGTATQRRVKAQGSACR